MKFVIDMLGGDLGIAATYEGLSLFMADHKDVEIIAVGTKNILDNLKNVKVVDANQVVKMDAHAMELLHDKESSMAKAINTLISEDADAIISCGGTGALLTLSTIKIKKLETVNRPALISPVPTIKGDKKTLLLDLGASNENKVEDLINFVKMAKIYYKNIYGEEGNFALLSNGSEEDKGSPLIQETHKKIKELKIKGFVGNIESTEILKGKADIIVTDGYSGNIALKAIEGTGTVAKQLLKETFTSSFKNKLAYLLVKRTLKKKLSMLSSKPLGGAMFIGIKKVVVKAHGNSDAIAFKNALETAYKCVKSNIVNCIDEGMKNVK